jgi:anti-sigma regulatory factor (Ser/Thr protein kinase)
MVVHPNVRLSLANTAENVVAVRAVLAGLAEAAGLRAEDLNDIRTAVSEACNNVVLHAYGGERGPMDVAIELREDAMRVAVRDRGVGIGRHAHEGAPSSGEGAPWRGMGAPALGEGAPGAGERAPGPEADAPGLGEGPPGAGERAPRQDAGAPPGASHGIGLHVIRTLARETRLSEPAGGGTSVDMEFAADGLRALRPALAGGPDADLADMPRFAAAVSVAPASLARAVVPRLAVALAVRAHFSIDRLSDVQMLADALAEHAVKAVCEQHVSMGVGVRPRDLELRIAPLRTGQAEGLVSASDLDGLGRVIEKLTDRHDIIAGEAHETLALSVRDSRRG